MVAISPVLVGATLGFDRTGTIDLLAAMLVFGAALLMQVITNMQNDVGYTVRGGDSSGTRTGLPRATANGWLSVQHVRTGIVLAKEGGAFPLMRRFFRLGLGGRLGSGRQWMSWIHLDDIARLILFCVENQSISGPVNGTAPWPVRNMEFTRALARAVHRPAVFNAPAFALRLLGEFSDELLGSKRVLPGLASAQGFPFEFPELPAAFKNLV